MTSSLVREGIIVILWWAVTLSSTHASTMCLSKCECHVLGNERAVNCENRGFKDIDPQGTDRAFVNYGDNKIKKISPGVFESYPKMLSLNLSHNSIHQLNEDTFQGAPYLKWLDLSHNLLRLQRSMHPKFLGPVEWLSLAGNEDIGRELYELVQPSEDGNMTTWLNSSNLRNMSLARCNLSRFPAWMIQGLTSLEAIDLSGNRLLVLPVLTLVSVCRLSSLSLAGNQWRCGDCNNLRSKSYMMEQHITDYMGYKFCSSISELPNCDVSLVYDEENVRNKCLSVPVPERIEYREPLSFWAIIGIVAASLVALVLLSAICNMLVSAICKRRRRTVTQRQNMDYTRDQEMLQVLPR